MRLTAHSTLRWSAVIALALIVVCPAAAQLNQNCTVSVLNRNVQVNADGSWVLPNIPANIGQVKARATCVQNGVTISGESAFFTVPANNAVNLPAITLGSGTQIPVSLALTPASQSFTSVGQTAQLVVTATYPDNSTKIVTPAGTGTTYTTSNAAIVSVAANGLLTATGTGTVIIQATNDGATGMVTARVIPAGNSNGGIPDDWAIANGLNPKSPTMPFEDPDRDGLTNLQEYQLGTNPNNPDTDGDGLSDSDEVNKYHTQPLLADTDGDGIPDGVEIQNGTDPLNATSYDLTKAVATFKVTPGSFELLVNALNPNASVQLTVTGKLIDGKTTIDLTSKSRRTQYSSNNLNSCTFGSPDGKVFASASGTCTITVTNSSFFTATVTGSVTNFTPAEVGSLSIPGSVAVDVGSAFAYVASGTNGLAVVDINNRASPKTRGSAAGIGNARAVRVSGQYAYVADSTGFLRVVNVLNPDVPGLLTSLAIGGQPAALALHANVVAVASQSGGVSLIDISIPTTPTLIAALTTAGSALGVDFDSQRGILAVAIGTGGLQLFDISNPKLPQSRGLLQGGNVLRVVLDYPAALLADSQRSITAVDITNIAAPVLASTIPSGLGGSPVDIAYFGRYAITADVSFGRTVPIVDVSNPLLPATLAYWTLGSPGLSSSIAMDGSFGYLIVPGTLRILQYQKNVDNSGIPPTVQLTSPSGTIVEGATILVTANATDDVGVASVTLFANGKPIGTTTAQPYQLAYKVPLGITSLTFGATATDFGNNTGTAADVTVSVIPDPLTAATGKVVDSNGAPVSGATVTVFARSSTTAPDGTFTITQIPTITGLVQVSARFPLANGDVLAGVSNVFPPILRGTINVGTITVGPVPIISLMSKKSALAGTQTTMQVTGLRLAGNSWTFAPPSSIGIQVASSSADGKSATLNLTIPTSVFGTFALVSTNAAGSSNSTITPANRFTAVDEKSLLDSDADGFPDVIEALFGSDPLDPAMVPNTNASGYINSPLTSILNALNPATGLSGSKQYVSGLTFSILNSLNPSTGVAGSKQYVSGLTFSLLNSLNPSTGIAGSKQYVSGLTFSMLNSLNPSDGVAGSKQYVASPTFSILNVLNPSVGVAGTKQYVSGLTFSVLNGISPASTTPFQRFASSRVFSISNTAPALVSILFDRGRIIERAAHPWLFQIGQIGPIDSDGDGISDEDEIRLGTNPYDRDTDHDGYPDGLEIALGSDPLDPNSIPNIKPPGFVISPGVLIQNYTLLGMTIVPVRPAEVRRQK